MRSGEQVVPVARARGWLVVLACTATALISACASAPNASAPNRDSADAPRSRPGGYYLDDGPGANPPANLDQIPDAQPKPEIIKASTARPYTAFGRTYTPMTRLTPYKERGTASWYGKRYHGQPTASGELYDMYAMTAAHPTLPIPSYARVTNVRSGKSVTVRINDRGPFRGDRLIDLSYTAAYKLGIVGSGSALVEVESILPDVVSVPPAVEADAQRSPAAVAATPSEVPPLPASDSPVTQEPKGVYVQLGAFSQRPKAESFLANMRSELSWLASAIGLYLRDGVYRVHAGPYNDRTQADQIATRIERSGDLRPVVITR